MAYGNRSFRNEISLTLLSVQIVVVVVVVVFVIIVVVVVVVVVVVYFNEHQVSLFLTEPITYKYSSDVN